MSCDCQLLKGSVPSIQLVVYLAMCFVYYSFTVTKICFTCAIMQEPLRLLSQGNLLGYLESGKVTRQKAAQSARKRGSQYILVA